mmetsp:Transcript_21509/g.32028  ORF Transcript_21509/g.32028 Transcript_21509/m.32028 type:complete len:348 (+) Transcript_21509:155-1198(+)
MLKGLCVVDLPRRVVACLVDLNVPLLGLLQTLEPSIVVKSLGFSNSLKHGLDTRHHTLKTTEVDVSTIGKLVKDLIGVFLNLVLDVHLSSRLVFLFTGQGVVQTEVFGVLLLGSLEFIIVQKGITVGNTQEKPGFSLVGASGRSVLNKETSDKTTVGSNTSSGGNHDVVRVGVFFRHKHNLSGRSSHGHFRTWCGVTQKVGADTLLGGIVSLEFRAPVGSTTHTERSGLSRHVITVTRRGDGVKTDGMGLSVLFTGAWGDHTPGLALPVGEVAIVVNDDVASFTSGLRSDNALGRNNLSCEGCLVLPHVDGDGRLVMVWLSLQEILGGQLSAKSRLARRSKCCGRSQ